MNQISQFLASIGKDTIFELVPGLGSLFFDHGRIDTYEAGQFVCEEGNKLFRVCISVDGPIRLIKKEDDGSERFVGYLQKGRALALKELLEGDPVAYTAVAERTTKVVSIPIMKFLDFLQASPILLNYLKIMTSSAGGRAFKRFLESNNLTKQEVINIIGRISAETNTFKINDNFVYDKPALYFVDSGTLRIKPPDRADEDEGATLTEGTWFGGSAFVSPRTFPFEVDIAEDTRLRTLQLTDELFDTLDRFQLVEQIHDEPFIKFSVTSVSFGNSYAEQPGRRVSFEDVRMLGVNFNPMTLNASSSDEGAIVASMKNIAEIHGVVYNKHNIAVDALHSGRLSPVKIASCLEPFGLVGFALRCEFDNLVRQDMPLLTKYGTRYVVILKASKHGVIIADPCMGFVVVNRDDFTERWNGQIIEVQPDELASIRKPTTQQEEDDETEKTKSIMRRTRRAIMRVAFKQKKILGNLVALNLFAVAMGAISPKITEKLVDDVIALRDWDAVVTLTVATVLVMITMLAMSVLQTATTIEYTHRLNQRIHDLFFRHYMRVKVTDHNSNRVGDFTAQFGEMNTLKTFFTTAPMQIGMQLLTIVLYSALLIQYDVQLTFLAFGMLPLIFVIRYAYLNTVKQNYERQYDLGKRGGSLITEAVSGIGTLKSLNAESVQRIHLERNNVEIGKLERKVEIEGSTINGLVAIITTAASTLAMWIGLKMASRGDISIGEVVAVNSYFAALSGPVIGLAGFFTRIEQVKVAWKRVAETLAKDAGDSEQGSTSKQSVPLTGKIKIEGLSFKYSEDGNWVLKDLDFIVYPGQTIAIVGRSGCGKSTLANIIAGNLAPGIGRVFFDNYESGQLSDSCKRSQIGSVLQENELFEGSVSENIAFGDDAIDDDDVTEAAVMASAANFIEKLPGQYQYYLGESGNGLSGGQKQRVSIARTLYKKPKILILDEATSALDSQSENAILSNMQTMVRNRTSLVIAHRLSTIRSADRIIVMKDGQIVEDGSHHVLLAKRGYYCELFLDQISSGVA